MTELERRHNQERDFFLDLLKDPDNEDIRDEAKNMSEDDRQKRITQLKDKREELDFEDNCRFLLCFKCLERVGNDKLSRLINEFL